MLKWYEFTFPKFRFIFLYLINEAFYQICIKFCEEFQGSERISKEERLRGDKKNREDVKEERGFPRLLAYTPSSLCL